jgi:hypothetical protein
MEEYEPDAWADWIELQSDTVQAPKPLRTASYAGACAPCLPGEKFIPQIIYMEHRQSGPMTCL